MPCYDTYLEEQEKKAREANPLHYAKEDAIKAINAFDKVVSKYVARNDILANMLCRVMSEIEYQEPGIVVDEDIKKWWEEHKKFDKERKKG